MRQLTIALAASCLLSAETPPPPHITFARVNPQPGQLSLFIAAADGSDEHPLLGSADFCPFHMQAPRITLTFTRTSSFGPCIAGQDNAVATGQGVT